MSPPMAEQPERRAFTVVACTHCPTGALSGVLDELRSTVRRSGHGVLVTAPCLLGALTCAAHRPGPGVMVVVQPCTIDRAPLGAAHWIGPLVDTADVADLRHWLLRGDWDRHALPDRLRSALDARPALSRRN